MTPSMDVWRFYECSNLDCPSKQRDALHVVRDEHPTGCVVNVRLPLSVDEPRVNCPACGEEMAYGGYVHATESGHIPDRGSSVFGEHGSLSGGEVPCDVEDGEDEDEPFNVYMTTFEQNPETGALFFVRTIYKADETTEQTRVQIPRDLIEGLRSVMNIIGPKDPIPDDEVPDA